jgi:CRP/FNR family transcriptional regulator
VVDKLLSTGRVKNFDEGEVILDEDASIKAIPIVIKGSLKVIRTDENGKELLLYNITAGESCIMSFLGGIHHETSKVKAIADEASEVLFIPVDKMKMLIHENPEWLDYIFRLYHKRFEELLEVVNAIAFQKVDERLQKLLMQKFNQSGNGTIMVTHEQLSNDLGTARVVVSRLLKKMEEDGMVILGRNRITKGTL